MGQLQAEKMNRKINKVPERMIVTKSVFFRLFLFECRKDIIKLVDNTNLSIIHEKKGIKSTEKRYGYLLICV